MHYKLLCTLYIPSQFYTIMYTIHHHDHCAFTLYGTQYIKLNTVHTTLYNVHNCVHYVTLYVQWQITIYYILQYAQLYMLYTILYIINNQVHYILMCALYITICVIQLPRTQCMLDIALSTVHVNVHFLSPLTLYIHSCLHHILFF